MWKEKYKIGVESIDKQHEELFSRVSQFVTILQDSTPWEEKKDKVEDILDFMGEYVIYHFNEEEEYQKVIGFPDLEQHKEIHQQFKDKVNEYVIALKKDFNEELAKEFSGKLMTWLIFHVAGTDQKIGEYIKMGKEN